MPLPLRHFLFIALPVITANIIIALYPVTLAYFLERYLIGRGAEVLYRTLLDTKQDGQLILKRLMREKCVRRWWRSTGKVFHWQRRAIYDFDSQKSNIFHGGKGFLPCIFYLCSFLRSGILPEKHFVNTVCCNKMKEHVTKVLVITEFL